MKTFLILFLALIIVSCHQNSNSGKRSFADKRNVKLFDVLAPEETGIQFENRLTESLSMNGLMYEYYYNGGGVSVADFNNDGLQDIYFISNLYENILYLNQGDLKFKDVSVESGTANIIGFPTGVTTVDINCDGWMDIYISLSGRFNDPQKRKNKLLINQGVNKNGIPTFKEEGAKYNLDIDLCSTQAAFFDYDRDNDLDLFLINHYPDIYSIQDIEEFLHTESNFTGDRLYQNRDGKFFDVSKEAGIINNRLSYGLGVAISDLNNDGWPDVFVSNDFSGKDLLYINNKNGTFSESVDEALNHMSFASMGSDIADINNDGWSDIFTLDMMAEDNYGIKTSLGSMNPERFQNLVNLGLHYQYMYNTLQLNNGILDKKGIPVFSDIAHIAGVSSTDWSWAPLLFDMDNDGNKDLFVANGIKGDFVNNDYLIYVNKRQSEIVEKGKMDKNEYLTSVMSQMPPRMKSNYFYKNTGNLTFEKMNELWVDEILTCSNGSAYADFDNDGDMDIIVNNSESKSFIYKNNAIENRLGNYLQFKLKGPEENPDGLGAKIIVHQAKQSQTQEQFLTRGFQSSISPIMHFGLGSDKIVPEVTVIWPDGKKQVITNVKPNQIMQFSYKNADEKQDYSLASAQRFTDVTANYNLRHKHIENNFNDFEKESLLPHKMSVLGPALAVGDVNNDGLEDFYIGGSKGQSGDLFIQVNGGFKALENMPWSKDRNCEDINATFFDADNDGDLDLYVTSGSNEDEEGSENLQDRIYLNSGSNKFQKADDALPNMTFSASCVKSCDFDSDGDIDLFVGGRQSPGKYPTPVTSCLLRNISRNGKVKFENVTLELAPQLREIGMVTEAIWVDVTNDNIVDLILVGEWMTVKIFKNNGSNFEDITEQSGIGSEVGWWNSISTGDFDKDGDFDLVVGNLGLNYKYKATTEKPFEVFAKDFDNNGSFDIVLGYYNEGDKLFPLRGRDCSSNQMPFIKQKFPTYDAFGKATLNEVYGTENLGSALNYKATNFATCYFENKGDGNFSIKPLPNLAQISSVNGIISEDIDLDGNLDLLIAGNMYGSEVETTRNDAGLGLFLKGDGAGNFDPVSSLLSGLKITGDVKNIELIHLGGNKTRGILSAKNNDFMQIIEISE